MMSSSLSFEKKITGIKYVNERDTILLLTKISNYNVFILH